MAQTKAEERPSAAVILGSNIYALRRAKDPPWSQEKLARRADLSRQAIVSAENNRDMERASNSTRLDTLEAIADALGVEVSDLLVWHPARTRVFLSGKSAALAVIPGHGTDSHKPRTPPILAIK